MDCWEQLGIEATDDQHAIKRAYLARLKTARPEEDPDGFQRVRAAYEAAMVWATSPKPTSLSFDSDDDLHAWLWAMAAQASALPYPPTSQVPDWFGQPPRSLYAPQSLPQTIPRPSQYQHDDGEALPDVLLESDLPRTNRNLLARIANGTLRHEAIDAQAAQALLAPRIGYRHWLIAVLPRWHDRMNRALIWISENDPEALGGVQSAVFRWWTSPRPQQHWLWYLSTIVVAVNAGLWATAAVEHHLTDAWAWLGIGLAGVLGAMVGYGLARGVAWLRLQYTVRLYWPWQAWDQRLAQKLPWVQGFLLAHDIGPTRVLLPLLLFFVIDFARTLSQTDGSEWGGVLFISAMVTAILGVIWYNFLQIFANSPGAMRWNEIRGFLVHPSG
ncbi:J domain-containing protein [Candidatus Symbiobacter mobilis]|uniref:DnaJ/HSP40 domain protein n=1 Tax=Candidatus Symbiobacter mobilis CR TaxID=946483 RepID=U5NBX0_9BURK|nr:J domain-containing protein [Candidatus Symbiobacter mobilis]AGX87738.1 DnaJ/HSP40 domain protein [Candidatus Symbiobacter mobilis CR]